MNKISDVQWKKKIFVHMENSVTVKLIDCAQKIRLIDIRQGFERKTRTSNRKLLYYKYEDEMILVYDDQVLAWQQPNISKIITQFNLHNCQDH